MNKKLYIGGIPYATGEDSLRKLFEEAGTVEQVDIIIDNMTGRSRGFGFVEMATEEDAQKAIEMFHDKEFEGRMLSVKEARPRRDA